MKSTKITALALAVLATLVPALTPALGASQDDYKEIIIEAIENLDKQDQLGISSTNDLVFANDLEKDEWEEGDFAFGYGISMIEDESGQFDGYFNYYSVLFGEREEEMVEYSLDLLFSYDDDKLVLSTDDFDYSYSEEVSQELVYSLEWMNTVTKNMQEAPLVMEGEDEIIKMLEAMDLVLFNGIFTDTIEETEDGGLASYETLAEEDLSGALEVILGKDFVEIELLEEEIESTTLVIDNGRLESDDIDVMLFTVSFDPKDLVEAVEDYGFDSRSARTAAENLVSNFDFEAEGVQIMTDEVVVYIEVAEFKGDYVLNAISFNLILENDKLDIETSLSNSTIIGAFEGRPNYADLSDYESNADEYYETYFKAIFDVINGVESDEDKDEATEDKDEDDTEAEDEVETTTLEESIEALETIVGSYIENTNYTFAENIRYGDTGLDVFILRYMLMEAGYMGSPEFIGMSFDDATRVAVKAYQRANGLPDTGLVGIMTRTELER